MEDVYDYEQVLGTASLKLIWYLKQGLNNIKWLRLSYNSLNNLASEAFAGLFTLNRLSLDHNELQFFPTQTMNRWDILEYYYEYLY